MRKAEIYETLRYPAARALIQQYGGELLPYNALSEEDHLAVDAHYGGAYDDTLFGVGEVPMAALKKAVLSESLKEETGHKTWKSYHEWYLKNNSVPSHQNRRWPVILEADADGESVITDGWHRLHSYARSGCKKVRVLWLV